jgi:protein arginine kinase
MASAIFKLVTCAQCGEREAIVFIRRTSGDSEGCDLALCASCADSHGVIAGKGGLELNIDDLIGSSVDRLGGRIDHASCPVCGLEIASLRREGRLGCAACAEAFTDEIAKALGRDLGTGIDPSDDRLPVPSRLPVRHDQTTRLRLALDSALRSENYEEAARLRDELSQIEKAVSSGEDDSIDRSGRQVEGDFPFDPRSLGRRSGPEEDVVLFSSARAYRDLAGLPFPGSPKAAAAPSRAALLERFQSLGSWSTRFMGELRSPQRRSLSERGLAPRGYASDDEAPILVSPELGAYALLDEGDHLRLRVIASGLDPDCALAVALDQAQVIGSGIEFARKPGLGWICARIADCGLGASLSALVHIPALSASGMRDRFFRALMSEGLSLRGLYSASEDSAGSVYEIGLEGGGRGSPRALSVAFVGSVDRLVAAERRARAEIATRGGAALRDAEGRALGIARYCSLLGADEAASLVSVLRLAALRGALVGADPRLLGRLLLELGSGSVSLAAGLKDIPAAATLDIYRAGMVKAALADAEYRIEEGA